MGRHTIYGLRLDSDAPLELPFADGGPPDIVVRRNDWPAPAGLDTTARVSFCEEGGAKHLNYAWIGQFRIAGGARIDYQPRPGVSSELLGLWLLGHPLAMALFQRGMTLLHGSLVGVNGGAAAFLGGSGWGKSTLAAAMHARGHASLGDDLTVVDLSGEVPTVRPGPPILRLAGASADLLAANARKLDLGDSRERRAYIVEDRAAPGPLRLRGAFTVEPGDAINLHCCSRAEAFIELTRHTYGARYFGLPEPKDMFHGLARLARRLPVHVLQRPKTFDALPEVCECIENRLEELR